MKFDILIAGIGGQGVILASRLLGLAAMKSGFHVATAETIGMSQREGSVTSHVRIADKALGPLIPKGCADLLLGLEPAEAARNITMLDKNGYIVVNTHAVIPASAAIGLSDYDPYKITSFIKSIYPHALLLDATQLARQIGNYKAANTVLLGATIAMGILPFDADTLWQTIANELPSRYLEVNKKAFEIGVGMVYNIKNQIDELRGERSDERRDIQR